MVNVGLRVPRSTADTHVKCRPARSATAICDRPAAVVVDVNGYVPAGATPGTLVPARLFESRPGQPDPTVDGQFAGGGLLASGSITPITVTGRGGVPADATAVILNVTAVDPLGYGFLTVFPCGADLPNASNVNYAPGEVRPNAVLAKVGDGGQVCVYTPVATHIVIDVNGYV